MIMVFGTLAPMMVQAQYSLPGNFGLSNQVGAVATISAVVAFLASILAVVAILMIVISGILYMVSAGDTGRIETAKSILTYAIIGLIVALLAWVIVSVVSNTLGAGDNQGGGGGGITIDFCVTNPTAVVCGGGTID